MEDTNRKQKHGITFRTPLEYLSEVRRDLRYSFRGMIKSPGFSLVGIISMAIGMGLTTVVYSSEWKLLTRDLPAAANAEQLVMIEKPVSYYYVQQYREQMNLFTGVAAFQNGVPFNVTFEGDLNGKPQRIFGQLVSADYFSVLGVPPQRGRVFNPELDKPGDAPVVVISDRFWRNSLNASPTAVGQTLHLNGQPATIVGITPKDFNGALSMSPAELFIPVTVPAALAPELADDVLHQRNARDFQAIICMKSGVTIESAEAALDTITRHLDEQDSFAPLRNDKSKRVTLLSAGTMVPLPRKLRSVATGFYLLLMGLIMVIACINLANMLLARGANRRKEIAIRLAIGASRFRLVRQMVSEGMLLAVLGGIAGFAFAYFLAKLNSQFQLPTAVPLETNFTPDWHAALFVFSVAIVSGIGFSLIPALRSTKADVTPALKQGTALHLPGYRRFGLRNLLMVAQVTGSLMLLLITGFLVIGISKASNVQTKFDPHTMYLFSIDPARDGYTPEKAQALFEKLPERLKEAAPIRSIVLTTQVPFSVEHADVQVTAEDSRGASRAQQPVSKEIVGAGYFAALNEPILAGREFVELDQRSQGDRSKSLPALLNESAVHAFFKNGNAIGEHLKDDKQSYEVVGVVRDFKNAMGENHSVVYLPITQRDLARPPANGITIMLQSDAGPDVLKEIRREIAFIDPKLNVFNVRTLNDYLQAAKAYERYDVNTYGGIGVFGLILAAIGLAGVTAYAVAQRRKEIGIRIALGASKGQILTLVLREGTTLVLVGTVLGFLGAFALAKMLSTLTNVFVDALKVGTSDPRLLIGAPLLLAALALLACYVPARKAARTDPLKALREG